MIAAEDQYINFGKDEGRICYCYYNYIDEIKQVSQALIERTGTSIAYGLLYNIDDFIINFDDWYQIDEI